MRTSASSLLYRLERMSLEKRRRRVCFKPYTRERRPHFACRYPDTDQMTGPLNGKKDVVHGSSFGDSCRRDRVRRGWHGLGWQHESAIPGIRGSGGVSQVLHDYWLTRSNHKLHVVTSGEGIVCNGTRDDFLSAHRNTGRNSVYSEVPVRNLCSLVVPCTLGG